MHEAMIALVDSLSKKSTKSGTEYAAYQRGLEFIEKLYIMNTLIIEKQLKEMDNENEEYTTKSI